MQAEALAADEANVVILAHGEPLPLFPAEIAASKAGAVSKIDGPAERCENSESAFFSLYL